MYIIIDNNTEFQMNCRNRHFLFDDDDLLGYKSEIQNSFRNNLKIYKEDGEFLSEIKKRPFFIFSPHGSVWNILYLINLSYNDGQIYEANNNINMKMVSMARLHMRNESLDSILGID